MQKLNDIDTWRIEIRASEMSKQNSLCFSRLTVCTSVQVQLIVRYKQPAPLSLPRLLYSLEHTICCAVVGSLRFRRNMPDHSSTLRGRFHLLNTVNPLLQPPLRRDLAIRLDGQEPLTTEKLIARAKYSSLGLGQQHAHLVKLVHDKRNRQVVIRQALRKAPHERKDAELAVLRDWISKGIPARSTGSLNVAVLAQTMRYRHVKEAEVLVAQFEEGHTFFIMLSGRLSQYEVLNESVFDDSADGATSTSSAQEPQPTPSTPARAEARLMTRKERRIARYLEHMERERELEMQAASQDESDKRSAAKAAAAAAAAAGLTTQQREWFLALLVGHHRRELAAKSAALREEKHAYVKRDTWKMHRAKRESQAVNIVRLKVFSAKLRSTAVPSRHQRRAAATSMQRIHRGNASRRMTATFVMANNAEAFDAAAARLQARARGRAARKFVEAQKAPTINHTAATKVQALHRGNEARIRTEKLRETRAPSQQAIQKLQARARANAGRSAFLEQKSRAVTLQARVRGRHARRALEEQHVAAIHIQSAHRRREGRNAVDDLRRHRKTEKAASAHGENASKPLIFVHTGVLEQGKDGFGDAALLFAERNQVSLIGDKRTEVAFVSRQDYLAALSVAEHELSAQRNNFIASLPAFNASGINDAQEALSALCRALVGEQVRDGDVVILKGSKMLIVESGELVLSRLHKLSRSKPLLVVGPGTFYGSSLRTRRLQTNGTIKLTAAGPCTLLWIDPLLISARLGQQALEVVISHEEKTLGMAIDGLGEHSKRPQSANSVWSHGPLLRRYEERSAALFASLPPKPSTPGEFRITPEQAHHDFVPRLRVGASVQQPAEKQDSIWSVMVARSEFDVPEVIRPPLPRSGPPPLPRRLAKALEDYVYLPELPPPTWRALPPAASPALTRLDGRSRPVTNTSKGSFLGAGAHPKVGLGEVDTGLATSHSTPLLLRPGSAVVAASSSAVLVEDAHGRWRTVPRRK